MPKLRLVNVLLNDVVYLTWVMMFTVQCSLFPAPEAPSDLPRNRQVSFHDISRMYNFITNPDDFILSQATFIVLGVSKMIRSYYYWRVSWLSFLVQLLQGISTAFHAILHGGISGNSHFVLVMVLAVTTMWLYFIKISEKKMTALTETIYLHICICSVCGAWTIAFTYMIHSGAIDKVIPCGMSHYICEGAYGMNFGYHEWVGIMWLVSLDAITGSEMLNILFERLRWSTREKQQYISMNDGEETQSSYTEYK